MKLLMDAGLGTIIVERKDRLTRFGFNYIEQFMNMQGRKLEVIFPSDTDNELIMEPTTSSRLCSKAA
jgi:putative resolvase